MEKGNEQAESKPCTIHGVMCCSCSKELTQNEIDRQLKVVGADDTDLYICDDCELDNYCTHLQTHDI